MNVLFVFPNASLSNRVRTNKICHFLAKRDWSIWHWGWLRKDGEDVESFAFPVQKKILIKSGGYSSSSNKLLYGVWMIKLFMRSWSIPRSSLVWAVGFESAFPLLLASKVIGYRIVFDDADRFSMVFPFPPVLKRVIQKLERVASRAVQVHIVPNSLRYEQKSEKLFELKNMPSRSDVEAAMVMDLGAIPKHAGITLYVNGLLDGPRGLDTVLRLALRLIKDGDKRIRFLVAGPLRGVDAEKFVELSNVVYLGRVANDLALALYREADFVLTYYDPTLEINRYAESNKWGDALKMGLPIIVNSEVVTAEALKGAGVAIAFPYADDVALGGYLSTVDQCEVTRLKFCVKEVGLDYPYFEEGLSNVVRMIGDDDATRNGEH